ncbi:MAG: hypothetical protein IH591_17295 [Bacteroidales bacterium]|nr:hypothetical protein [Bacteroidales bacterium]
MKQKKGLLIIGLVLLTGVLVYQFLFGKLFPYSPVIIGFERHEFANTYIYTQAGVVFDEPESIDLLIPPIERFHEINYLKKPRIFLFADSQSYIRHSPSKARFCVFYNSRLFVTPWAMKEAMNGDISLETYLTHELSHSLLHQHSGFVRAGRYPKWLLEGIAVYSSNQMGTTIYPSMSETYQLINSGNFMPPEYFKTRRERRARPEVYNSITFLYSEFACIVDYLIESRGKEKFMIYMKRLIKSRNHDKIFEQIYSTDFESFLEEFRQFVADNQNPINS